MMKDGRCSIQQKETLFTNELDLNLKKTLVKCYIILNYNQQDATFFYLFISTDALHVSGGFSAHHQEHTTVHTASGIVNQYGC